MSERRRVALVTGATSDIGAAICRALAAAGNDVAVHRHRDSPAAEALAGELRTLGVRSAVVSADVSSMDAVTAMGAQISDDLGAVEVLVNAAAYVRFERFLVSEPAQWLRQIEVTLIGAMNTCKVFGGAMVQAGSGRIVNIAAEGAITGEPALAVATAAKAGLLGLTRTLALEFAPGGVTVNAVSPGFIPTSSTPAVLLEDDRLKTIAARYPMRRLGRPADIAAAVAYLCSHAAGYVTGQTVSVSGGLSVR